MSASWLLSRDLIVALAITGGVLSIASSVLAARRAVPAAVATWCNRSAYAFMGASMLLFIAAGFSRP